MNFQVSRAHIERMAEQIAHMCDGDEQLLQDMLEGETDLIKLASQLHEQFSRDNEMLAGIAERKAALIERERRIKSRAANVKAMIGDLLRDAKLTKLELPEVTYSVRDGKPKLSIVNPDAVSDDCVTLVRKPVMAAINEKYSDAESLPNWLVREPATDIVTARAK